MKNILTFLLFFSFLYRVGGVSGVSSVLASSAPGEIECLWDVAHSKKSLSPLEKKEKKSFLKKFHYNFKRDHSLSESFHKNKLLLWREKEYLFVKILPFGGDRSLMGKFLLSSPEIVLSFGGDLYLSCKGDPEFKKSSQKELKTSSLGPSKLREKVRIVLGRDLTFPYTQPEEVQLMRTLFFQGGKIKKSSSQILPQTPWCSLRIQLTRDEDTTLRKGEEIIPVSFQKMENGSIFTTFSYSFVDFSQGKKRGGQRLYNPFMFICNLSRGKELSRENLRKIVGKSIFLREL